MRFQKITEEQMSGGAVNLAIKRSDEGIVFGMVVRTIATHAGPSASVSEAPVPQAIAEAATLAERADQSVVYVVDRDGLWQPKWGILASQ